VTGLGGGADKIADDGDCRFLEVTLNIGGEVRGWGSAEVLFFLNEAGQEMRELLGRRFPPWIDHGLGDAQEIDVLKVWIIWIRVVFQRELWTFPGAVLGEG
jgi:hypothetical protein